MLRRFIVIVGVLVFVLSGCSPFGQSADNDQQKKLVTQNKDTKQDVKKQVQITPNAETAKVDYRTLADFKPSEARGLLTNYVDSRLDIAELQTGLMRHSKKTFSPKDYIFREGQILTDDILSQWLARECYKEKLSEKEDKKLPACADEGLNPVLTKKWGSKGFGWKDKKQYKLAHPAYLSAILEQDYLKETSGDKVTLGGISIAISVHKVYDTKASDDDGKYHFFSKKLDFAKVKKKVKQDAQKIVKRLRKKPSSQNIPIVVTLYQEAAPGSLVPGHYFAKTVVASGQTLIDDWQPINESYVLFPPTNQTKHKNDLKRFNRFKQEIKTYFPNFIGVIGKGFYIDKQLQSLDIQIPLKFYSQTEIISFTQYVAGLVADDHFPFRNVPVSISISTSAGPEALIVSKPKREHPFVHIYH